MHRLCGLSLKHVEGSSTGNRQLSLYSSVEKNGNAVMGLLSKTHAPPHCSPSMLEACEGISKHSSQFMKFDEYHNKRYFATQTETLTEKLRSGNRQRSSVVAAKFAAENNNILISKSIPSIFEQESKAKSISIFELKKMEDENQDYLLIDLRESEMRLLEPSIPSSVHFPIEVITKGKEADYDGTMKLQSAMRLSENAFATKFSFKKPSTDQKIIFYSNTGKRSQKMAEFAESQLGFTDVSSLLGGSRLYNKHYFDSDLSINSVIIERTEGQIADL
eukprot:TRINITY_DN3804_c0_g1_i1.p1 TRINITY_DN3804_c0_g1~~TRINITY_DN3804_c0_g1_i1.p1  ORF type:complete len:305 (+),score=104.63 TRINITY_DN3804_c0_g1_i1:90-917(+)